MPKAKLDHHAVAVIQGDKVSGVVHFYQLNGPTSAVKIVGQYIYFMYMYISLNTYSSI